jgi:tRNA dimethylallyltransferase
VIILTGPTSTGKTSLALKLAKEFGPAAELISADSRQIYKYMDVGTGKKPIDLPESSYKKHKNYWEIENVKIHMYDVVAPNEEYSSFQYAEDAKEIARNIKIPIIVGGTGFYIDTLSADSIDANTPNDSELRNKLSEKSLKDLQKMIPEEYLETWNNSEKNNPARLIRAIVIFNQTGRWMDKNKKPVDPSENNLVIELTAPREYLYKRVNTWADSIWESLLYEIKTLEKLGYDNSPPANGIVYKTAKSYIAGEIDEENALKQMKFNLHRYIRRQQTWFKKYKKSIKVDITKESFDTTVQTLVKSYLDG